MENVKIIKCSGCSACYLVCPVNAIKMGINRKGFFERSIDENLCVHCGLCLNVCPHFKAENNDEFVDKESYIAYAKDSSILEKSSSGGVSFIISNYFLQNNYNICSVVYDSNSQKAMHVLLQQYNLKESQGSKYLQSINDKAFKSLIDFQEKSVVFGTPCQIAGLHNNLVRLNKRDDYILVDIFCHGIPSYLVWNKHLEWIEMKKKIDITNKKATFRYKKNFRLKIGNYYEPYNGDAFMTIFLQNSLMCEQCYQCCYRRKSKADLRIGDLSVNDYKKMDISPSVIIVNTQKGREVLDMIQDQLIINSIPYKDVDKIQDKGIKQLPDDYYDNLNKLQNGYYPNQIMMKLLNKKRLKSIIRKIQFFLEEK